MLRRVALWSRKIRWGGGRGRARAKPLLPQPGPGSGEGEPGNFADSRPTAVPAELFADPLAGTCHRRLPPQPAYAGGARRGAAAAIAAATWAGGGV